jgi:hypothetical protein
MRSWRKAGVMAGLSVVLGCTHASSPVVPSFLELGKGGQSASSRIADRTDKAKAPGDLSLAGMPPAPPGVIKVTPDMMPGPRSQPTVAPSQTASALEPPAAPKAPAASPKVVLLGVNNSVEARPGSPAPRPAATPYASWNVERPLALAPAPATPAPAPAVPPPVSTELLPPPPPAIVETAGQAPVVVRTSVGVAPSSPDVVRIEPAVHIGRESSWQGPAAEVPATAQPGHAPDYAWLVGELQYLQTHHAWRLRYARPGDEDRYGGTVTLTGDNLPAGCQSGQLVRVEGHLINPDASEPRPAYWVGGLRVVKPAPLATE